MMISVPLILYLKLRCFITTHLCDAALWLLARGL